jgi:hypothetical protein
VLYASIGLYALVCAATVLLVGLLYDHLKFKILTLKRKLKNP